MSFFLHILRIVTMWLQASEALFEAYQVLLTGIGWEMLTEMLTYLIGCGSRIRGDTNTKCLMKYRIEVQLGFKLLKKFQARLMVELEGEINGLTRNSKRKTLQD
ncbi:hypothetical protein L1887_05937 [Cichorium endivia]|nr:hypothetical protein L1887_05937 [Cichorium endivia]